MAPSERDLVIRNVNMRRVAVSKDRPVRPLVSSAVRPSRIAKSYNAFHDVNRSFNIDLIDEFRIADIVEEQLEPIICSAQQMKCVPSGIELAESSVGEMSN